MPRTIMIPVDGSDNSKRALHFYIEEMRKPEDALFLLHVHVPPSLPTISMSDPLGAPVEEWQRLIRQQMENSQKVIEYYSNLCDKEKIQKKVLMMAGQPGETICKQTVDHHVDIVLIGSRGLNGVRQTFMGSVSDYVLHHCALPVVVIPPKK